MKYAIAHATKGTTFVAVVPEEVDRQPEIRRLTSDPTAFSSGKGAKIAFLETVTPGDKVYLDLGGAADKLALALLAARAKVLRYPSFLLGPDNVREVIARHGWPIVEEKAAGDETSDDLTARKCRVLALAALAGDDPERFVETKLPDVSFLELKVLIRSYLAAQKAAMRAVQSLLASYRGQAFLAFTRARLDQEESAAQDADRAVLNEFAQSMLGGEVSEIQREGFEALVGKVFGSRRIPLEATEEQVAEFIAAMVESDQINATMFERLKVLRKKIETLLKGGRVKRSSAVKATTVPADQIWEQVFEPIPGCGPLIAARMMAGIADIRNFGTVAQLKSQAGYGHEADGSRARRKKGEPSRWGRLLKQGTYLFAAQTLRMPSSPWRTRLDQRKAYELYNILKERQRQGDEQGLGIEILPAEFASRTITSVNDMTVADYEVKVDTGKKTKKGKPIFKLVGGLSFHVDHLRDLAGIKRVAQDEDENDLDAVEEEAESAATAKNPALAKLVRRIKQQALDRALRWLGQQFLKHVFKEWRKAVGLPELPVRPAKSAAEA